MLNIGGGEIALILIAALLLLGPKRLPEMARVIGKFVREFRRQTDDVRGLVEREFYKMDEEVVRPLEQSDDNRVLPPGATPPADDPADPSLHPDHPDNYKDDNSPVDSSFTATQASSPVTSDELKPVANAKTELEIPVAPTPITHAVPQAVSREKLREQQAADAAATPSPDKVGS